MSGQRDRAMMRLDHLDGVMAGPTDAPAEVRQKLDRVALVERGGHAGDRKRVRTGSGQPRVY
jgi:hypothetical protein